MVRTSPEGGFREGNRDNGYHRRKRWKRERGESRNPYKQVQIQFPLRSGRHSPNLLKRGEEATAYWVFYGLSSRPGAPSVAFPNRGLGEKRSRVRDSSREGSAEPIHILCHRPIQVIPSLTKKPFLSIPDGPFLLRLAQGITIVTKTG